MTRTRSFRALAVGTGVLIGAVACEAVAAALIAGAWSGLRSEALAAGGTGALSRAAGCVALGALAPLVAWTGAALAVAVFSALRALLREPGRPIVTKPVAPRSAAALAPAVLRRAVGALMGVVTVAAVVSAAPAYADPARAAIASAQPVQPGLSPDRPAAPVRTDALDPAPIDAQRSGWRASAPGRRQSGSDVAAAALATGGATRLSAAQAEDDAVTVRRGDTLWSIAARHLHATGAPHRATDVAREWPRWWQANVAVVGADPDVLLPGQQLQPPPVS